MKPWSIFWRLLLAYFALALVFGIAVHAAVNATAPSAVQWKQTLLWWLLAIFFWITTSVSSSFLETLLFGRKLKFTPESWLKIGGYAALLFLALGAANLIVFELSTSAWSTFQIAAIPVGLALLSVALGSQIKQIAP